MGNDKNSFQLFSKKSVFKAWKKIILRDHFNITSKVKRFPEISAKQFAYIISWFHNLMDACWLCNEAVEMHVSFQWV